MGYAWFGYSQYHTALNWWASQKWNCVHNVTVFRKTFSQILGHKAVCEITFETWADTLSGHDEVRMNISGVIWTLLKLWV